MAAGPHPRAGRWPRVRRYTARVPVLIRNQQYLLFAHVPKTGGTSIEKHFRAAGWDVDLRDQRVGPGSRNYVRRCSPQHLHAAVLSEIVDLSRVRCSFMVVRDPLARFRSEYAMRQKDPARTDSDSVDAWADRVLDRRAQNPYTLDNHLRPQHEFALPDMRVYRLEDGLDTVLADLNTEFALELPPRIEHRLQESGVRHGIASRDVELSPALTGRLQDLYAEDYRRFGYPL